MNLWWLLRTWPQRRALHRSISRTTGTASTPDRRSRVWVDGMDPLRVQVLGSGLAVGYGVTDRQEALDGHLARLLAAAIGRGVSVENLAEHDAVMTDQIFAAGISDSLDLHDVTIWVPSSLEMCRSWWPRGWSSRLAHLLEHLTRCQRVIVLAIPQAEGDSPYVRIGAQIAAGINAGLEQAARRFPSVTVVHPPRLPVHDLGAPALTSDYYRACAAAIAEAFLTSRTLMRGQRPVAAHTEPNAPVPTA